MNDDLTIPDFLNRKLNPMWPATVEERREYAARCPAPVEEPKLSMHDPELQAEIAEEKKAKAHARIAKMKARMEAKSQTKGIPDEHLGWDSKRLRFYDMRVRNAQRLAAARKRLGL